MRFVFLAMCILLTFELAIQSSAMALRFGDSAKSLEKTAPITCLGWGGEDMYIHAESIPLFLLLRTVLKDKGITIEYAPDVNPKNLVSLNVSARLSKILRLLAIQSSLDFTIKGAHLLVSSPSAHFVNDASGCIPYFSCHDVRLGHLNQSPSSFYFSCLSSATFQTEFTFSSQGMMLNAMSPVKLEWRDV